MCIWGQGLYSGYTALCPETKTLQCTQQIRDAVDMFAASYSFLARRMHQRGLSRFHLEPSLHLYQHMAHRLHQQLATPSTRILSPAAFLSEAGEDFIGRVARVSRRVSARLQSQRTLQRMLIQTHAQWKALA